MNHLFVDVDTGVDDAVALVYLFASADADVVGIASTGGNIGVDQVCANNLGLLELCRAGDIPVSKGADEPLRGDWPHHSKFHGANGLGYAELPPTDRRLTSYDATRAWVAAAQAYPGELIGLVTGPLTNLALALRTEPALPSLLRRLVIMGGAFDSPGNVDLVAEWNIRVDPEAASEVFAAWKGTATTSDRLRPESDPTGRDDTGNPGQAGVRVWTVPVDPGDRRRDAVLFRVTPSPRTRVCGIHA